MNIFYPPIYFLIILAFQVLANKYFPLLLLYQNIYISIILFVIGSIFGGSALLLFVLKKTTIIHGKYPKKLVVVGPYRITRNPMYLSLLLFLVASAFYLGSVSSYLLAVLFWAGINWKIIVKEEEIMKKKFGAQYKKYSESVRRWI